MLVVLARHEPKRVPVFGQQIEFATGFEHPIHLREHRSLPAGKVCTLVIAHRAPFKHKIQHDPVKAVVLIRQQTIVPTRRELHIGASFLSASFCRKLCLFGDNLKPVKGPAPLTDQRRKLSHPRTDFEHIVIRINFQQFQPFISAVRKNIIPIAVDIFDCFFPVFLACEFVHLFELILDLVWFRHIVI